MNILDILRKLGYEVCAFTEDGIYSIQYSKEHRQRISKAVEEGTMRFEGDLYGTYKIKVDDVGFNGFGDLYVFFKEVDCDKNEYFDRYEYRNIEKEDLFE